MSTTAEIDWHARAENLGLEGRAFIDGRFRDALFGRTMPTVNPATGARLAMLAACDLSDVDLAVAAARRVFEART